MRIRYHRRRLADFAGGIRLSRELTRHEARLRDSVSRRLAELGVAAPRVAVERREALARSAGGKLQMVVAEPVAHERSLG